MSFPCGDNLVISSIPSCSNNRTGSHQMICVRLVAIISLHQLYYVTGIGQQLISSQIKRETWLFPLAGSYSQAAYCREREREWIDREIGFHGFPSGGLLYCPAAASMIVLACSLGI
jgi:hypothetical protein